MRPPDVIHKYPSTRHLPGSALQLGDHPEHVPFAELAGRHLIVERKIDGSQAGISFDAAGHLWLQSRGHYLTGGPRERQFELLKAWAATHRDALHAILGDRYVMYGEWLYAKHTVFYSALPHLFLEFDLYDRIEQLFLSTRRRRQLLAGSPVISVPVVHEGAVGSMDELVAFNDGPALYKTPDWREALDQAAVEVGARVELTRSQTDPSDQDEGLYVKHEDDDVVLGRYKWVRPGFIQTITEANQDGQSWFDRPLIANRLADGVDVFSG